MSNRTGIQLAIEIATQKRDACQKRLSIVERHHSATLGQMEQLQSYAVDKDIHWTSPSFGAVSGEIVKHHYQFMGRLQEAMNMQSGAVSAAGKQVAGARLLLAEAETRLEGLKRVYQNRVKERDMKVKRQDQKQTDDFASQQYARRRAQIEQGESV